MKKIMALVLIAGLGVSGCSPHFHLTFLATEKLQESILLASAAREKIVVIDVSGTISAEPEPGLLKRGSDMVAGIYAQLDRAAGDRQVRGIILRLDTPGGEVTASDILYHEIRRFKERTGIPVLTLMMGIAASGGYYLAMASDWLVAHPTTITGSIGVIAVLPSVQGLLDKVGIQMQVIKSGELKGSGSPYQTLNDAGRAQYQNLIDGHYQRFLRVVEEGRGRLIAPAKMTEVADGRIFSAAQALELKLIDEIGYFDAALKRILSLAKIPAARVVSYTHFPLKKTNIYAQADSSSPLTPGLKRLEDIGASLKSGFYYLWLPGD